MRLAILKADDRVRPCVNDNSTLEDINEDIDEEWFGAKRGLHYHFLHVL
jgi:hypothetical protein